MPGTHVGRYIVDLNSDGTAKLIDAGELAGLKAAGLKLFPIEERYNNVDDQMSESIGRTQGIEVLERCRTLGLPAGSTVFFAVDYDPAGDSISGPVTDYFTGIDASMDTQLLGKYKVGVYGTRNVCSTMIALGKAQAAFVVGMSPAGPGTWASPCPILGSTIKSKRPPGFSAGVDFAVDHDAVSINAEAINLSGVTPPPTEKDDGNSATGFDVV
jgi:peptidoglycan hydrolase-like protein with peptidoglycan-binding domain